MKIGIIGAGNVGASLGTLLARADHEIRFGSRDPQPDTDLPGLVGTIAQAAAFGDVVLCAAPYGAWPELAPIIAPWLKAKSSLTPLTPTRSATGRLPKPPSQPNKGPACPSQSYCPEPSW